MAYRRSRRVMDQAFSLPGRVTRGLLAAVSLALLALPTGAHAQGLFDALFGPSSPQRSSSRLPPGPGPGVRITVHPRADLGEQPPPPEGAVAPSAGPQYAYCVRTCDGRFFPMPASDDRSDADKCRSFCPAADVKVYYGTSIDGAENADGRPYSQLANAFRYRNEFVEKCTCNGASQLGLAKVAIADDPTLRVGDIVTDARGILLVTETRTSARRGPRFRPLSGASAHRYGIPTAAFRPPGR